MIKAFNPAFFKSVILVSRPAANIKTITPISDKDSINLLGPTIFNTAGPKTIPAINAPTTDGIRKRREKSPKAFVINKIKAISNRYRYSCIFIPPTMLLEVQTPFVEVANLHHETPTDMPSILSAFSFHDIHI